MTDYLKAWLEPIQLKPLEPFQSRLELAIHAALSGGRKVFPLYKKESLEIKEKKPGDLVTEADLASNQEILGVLEKGSKIPIRSEECSYEPNTAFDHLWVVDPLDGTKDFVNQTDDFSIMIGTSFQGRAELGVVDCPAQDKLFFGVVGIGSWVVQNPHGHPVVRSLSPLGSVSDPLRMVRSRSHPDKRLQMLEQRLDNVDVTLAGSVGVKCSLIAEDQADFYVHPVPFLKEWDTCAPEAILRGAGGRVTDCLGNALTYGKENPKQLKGILATKPSLWEMLQKITSELIEVDL